MIGAAVVGLAIVGYLQWTDQTIPQNERAAYHALRSLASANADFRATDRDGNQVNDFWTGDVAGLYYLRPNTGKEDAEIRLIPREIAEADAAPLKPLVPTPVPYRGYLFRALDEVEFLQGTDERFYKVDTGGKPPMGKVHNMSKFGFVAFPIDYPRTGRTTFLIDENYGIVRIEADGQALTTWPLQTPKNPPTQIQVVEDALQLKKTTVTAHLLENHGSGRNLIWCASFQMAWDALEKMYGFPLDLEGKPPMAAGLNRKLTGTEVVDPARCLILAGRRGSNVLEQFQLEMKSRFPHAQVPPLAWPPEGDAMAFAYLSTDLPFAIPLFRHRKGISFLGAHVTTFGLWDGHTEKPTREQLRQVTVRNFVSDQEFVVELHATTKGERILVARVNPGATLLDTVKTVMERGRSRGDWFKLEDDLIIPCVNFDLTRQYPEVIGRTLLHHPEKAFIGQALQKTRFRLDEEGAKLESLAAVATVLNGDPPKGRKMICDGPFLILLAREGAALPYFAYWVENDELLVR